MQRSDTTGTHVAVEPLFASTDHALRYAYAYSTQQYGRSAMAAMYAPPSSGRGLGGMDGAAQAGMIRAEIAKLTPAQQAVLAGRYAPPDLPCSCGAACCSKRRPNLEWQAAIEWLARQTAVLFSGHMSNERLRRVLVRIALSGEKAQYTEIGKQFGVDRHTVAKHAQIIEAALVGTRSENGELDRAILRLDQALCGAEIVGSS